MPRRARRRGCVAVDTNVIIEAHRVGAWRALTGGYPVETVEQCRQEALAEPASGARTRIEAKALAAPRMTVHAVSSRQRAALKHRKRDAVKAALHPKTPGRNRPCSCGSGKKYKHCCGRAA